MSDVKDTHSKYEAKNRNRLWYGVFVTVLLIWSWISNGFHEYTIRSLELRNIKQEQIIEMYRIYYITNENGMNSNDAYHVPTLKDKKEPIEL